MQIMRRNFGEMNPVRVGIAGIAGLLAIVLVALNAGTIIEHVTTTTYQADFSDAGGLATGDSVVIGGLTMGTVKSVALQGTHVLVTFNVKHGGTLGADTGASISTESVLGTKELEVTPSGSGTLSPGSTIPLSRTTSPYDLAQVLSTLTDKASAINSGQVAQAFSTIASTLQNSPPALKQALSGVQQLSETIASRDNQLTSLLNSASSVTGLLADRSQQVSVLITDGNELLNTLYERRDEIQELLVNVTAVTDQIKGLVNDNNSQIGPALAQLQSVENLLGKNSENITQTIAGLQRYTSGLGEIVSDGPWFYAYVANIVPTNLAPQLSSLLAGDTGISSTSGSGVTSSGK
jgi:phospholipid/cholesterol/gamma-HCH transport system substrate-binding protein